MPEFYIRGNTVMYLRIPDEVIDKVQEGTHERSDRRPVTGSRGRGRGRGEDGDGRGPVRGGRGGGDYQEEGADRNGGSFSWRISWIWEERWRWRRQSWARIV